MNLKGIILYYVFTMFCVSLYAQQHVSFNQLQPAQNRSIGVHITCLNYYSPGATMDLQFELNLTTPDLEYADSIALNFPAGFTVNNGSDPFTPSTEGQGAEVLNLPINSPLITWGDNDNSWGGVEPGVHQFFVNVSVASWVSGPQTMGFYISGDQAGAAPHHAIGNTIINELLPSHDLRINGYLSNVFDEIPRKLPFYFSVKAEVENRGAPLNAQTFVEVLAPTLGYSHLKQLVLPVATNYIDTVEFPDLTTNSIVGNHSVRYQCNAPNDFNPTDNYDTLFVNITDSSLSYRDTITDGSFSMGDGLEGSLVSLFYVPKKSVLTSVSVYLTHSDANAQFSMLVYNADPSNGEPAQILFESDTIGVSGNLPALYNFHTQLILEPGNRYFIGVREQVNGAIGLGTNSTGYEPKSHYVYVNNDWHDIGSFALQFSLAVIPHFGVHNLSIDTCVAGFQLNADSLDPLIAHTFNTSTTTGIDSLHYLWDFGDGNTSTVMHPSHLYDTAGTYPVCLTVYSSECADTLCKNFDVVDTGTSVLGVNNLTVKMFPNPAKQHIQIVTQQPVAITVYNLAGQIVIAKQRVSLEKTIPVSHLYSGYYLVEIEHKNVKEFRKLIISR